MLAMLVLLPLCMAAGVWPIVGVGTILFVVVGAAGVFSVLCLVVMVLSQRPRVVLTPEGFLHHKLFGCLAHKWEDIDGRFAVIKIGWSKAVAYKLATDYKARVGKNPTSHLSGYDEAIGGQFAISKEELAELLNIHHKHGQG